MTSGTPTGTFLTGRPAWSSSGNFSTRSVIPCPVEPRSRMKSSGVIGPHPMLDVDICDVAEEQAA